MIISAHWLTDNAEACLNINGAVVGFLFDANLMSNGSSVITFMDEWTNNMQLTLSCADSL